AINCSRATQRTGMPVRVGWMVNAAAPNCAVSSLTTRWSSAWYGGMYSAWSAVIIWIAIGQRLRYGVMSGSGPGLHVVRTTQIGDLNPLVTLPFALRRHICSIDTLITYHPGQWAALLVDRLLQQHQSLQEGFGAGRAAGNIDVHRQEFVHALNHRVDVVHAAGIGAGAHGDDPFGLEHLFVQSLDDGGHLDEGSAGNDHEVRLSR